MTAYLAYLPAMRLSKDSWVLVGVALVTSGISIVAVLLSQSTWLEAFSFVSGALCVWLTVKQRIWNFPISLMNVTAFLFVFARAHLYADAGLQVVYFVLTAIGWWMWLFGGKGHTPLRVSRIGRLEAACVALCGAMMLVGLWQFLRQVGGSATFLDALTTSLSLCAQWLLNRKRLESWYCWIAVDIVYVPLYLYKQLYLTAGLYTIFLCMATMGLLEWRKAARQQTPFVGELVAA